MKKPVKIILLVSAAITVIAVIVSLVMLKAVSGDDLFYMDSSVGKFYAVSYRWVCLASGILILFWFLLAVIKRKEIAAWLQKFKYSEKKTVDDAVPTVPIADAKTAPAVFCAKCGMQMAGKSKFCPSCGAPSVSPPTEN